MYQIFMHAADTSQGHSCRFEFKNNTHKYCATKCLWLQKYKELSQFRIAKSSLVPKFAF